MIIVTAVGETKLTKFKLILSRFLFVSPVWWIKLQFARYHSFVHYVLVHGNLTIFLEFPQNCAFPLFHI